MNHLKITNTDDLLLHQQDKKVIESPLIDYIMSLRQDGIAHATIKHLVALILTFYVRNDVPSINRKKVFDYLMVIIIMAVTI
jgi:hypothetical protein